MMTGSGHFMAAAAVLVLDPALGASANPVPASAPFDPAEIRQAEAAMVAALEKGGTGWVQLYTEDAVFQEGEAAPVAGRKALTELASQLGPLANVSIIPLRTEGQGNLAYVQVRATYGAPGEPAARMQGVMIWRKEADGQWRMLHEALVPEK